MPEPVSIERVTKDYYDSEDAFCFYQAIWGGESIHIGLYDEIKLASCDGVSPILVSRFCNSAFFPSNLVVYLAHAPRHRMTISRSCLMTQATEVEKKSEWSKMSARLATAAMYSKTGQTLNKDSKVADLGSA